MKLPSSVTTSAERLKYEAVWKLPVYRAKCHSLTLRDQMPDLFPSAPDERGDSWVFGTTKVTQVKTAIDIGCGLGRLLGRWNDEGIDAWGVDLAGNCLEADVETRWGGKVWRECLWEFDPGRVFDFGVCADVMEHIPEEWVDETLDRMAEYCERIVFKIANYPSESLGYSLHLTQRDDVWWRSRLWTSMGGSVNPVSYSHAGSGKAYVFTWHR